MTATHPHRRSGGDHGMDQPGLLRWFRARAGLTISLLIKPGRSGFWSPPTLAGPANTVMTPAAVIVSASPPRPDRVRSKFRREHPQEAGLRRNTSRPSPAQREPAGIHSWTVTRSSSQSFVHGNWSY